VFVHALGAARTGDATAAATDLDRLQELRANLVEAEGDVFKDYWLTQIDVHRQMVTAWIANAQGSQEEALQTLRTAADREDAIERDPVVPGPIISARELLGEMLLESNRPQQALQAFEADLRNEPSRFCVCVVSCSTRKSWLHFRSWPVDFCCSRLAIGAATERARALAMPPGTRAQASQTRL
jgi:hypothetical protein